MNVGVPPVPRNGGRVVELVAPRELVVVERPVPVPAPGEARVRITAVGVCGTDIHGFLGRSDRFPVTLGHDAVAVVDAVGDGVDDAVVGLRVTIDPTIACGACASCTAGLPQVCLTGGYLGMTGPGAMADYLTVPVWNLVGVPAALGDTEVTVLEPVAVALHLLGRIGDFSAPGMQAHVVGGGPLGVLLAQTLATHGWTPTVHEPVTYRRDIAAACGLAVGDGSCAGDLATGPVLVVETSAAPAGVALARRLAAPGSCVALVGRAPADFTSAEILLKELTVLGVRSGIGQYAASMALVASGAVTPDRTITHTFALADAARAMTSIADGTEPVMRAVLRADQADAPTDEETS